MCVTRVLQLVVLLSFLPFTSPSSVLPTCTSVWLVHAGGLPFACHGVSCPCAVMAGGALGSVVGECMSVLFLHVVSHFFISPLSPLSPLFRLSRFSIEAPVAWCGWMGATT